MSDCADLSLAEDSQVDRFADGREPRIAAVQVVAHVVALAHLPRIGRIGERGVEPDDCVERAAAARSSR